ncbi:methionyl-tRNA synthetase [Chlorella sorokiniana]|uniref:Methionyl-tRNA synthetase n=1 Tax=Chlorella sorokiniana TaxID=3076 RepID=A0A2P6TIP8_CHLSO|nr:methionyl-tRNA synthetase [Chlorella sorokiniana]|eukprot:PRW39127.1 methionyl-tRNA synthetase [Chlorella sorokiniana]
MAHSVTAPDAATESLLRLVAEAGGVQHLNVTIDATSSDVRFTAADGTPAFGTATACRWLASLGSAAAQLLGETPEQAAKIAEWVSFRTALKPLMDAQLAELNDALATRTYIAGGSRPSLADLVLYAAVAPAACTFPVAQHGHFCNLLRWYDLLHHTVDVQHRFPAAVFERPRYVAPPPPAPAEPKAAKGGAGDKAADKAAAGDKAAPAPAASASSGKKGGDKAAAPAAEAGGKGDKKAKKEKGAAPATPAASTEAGGKGGDDECTVDLLDIRVGQIVKVDRHPNADALYLEEIDLGEGQPRQVVSGLVKFVPVDKMQGRRVLVVCNLKPAKMRDVMSYGMVLCASNEEHTQVDPILPPEGAAIGERVSFAGFAKEPEAQLNPKKKQFEKIAPELKVDASGVCGYRGVPMMTSQGPVTASIPNAWIK